MSEYEFKVGDRVRVRVEDGARWVNQGVSGVVLGVSDKDVQVDHGGDIGNFWYHPRVLEFAGGEHPDEPDMVEHPNHYSAGTPDGIEVIDILRAHEAAGGTWETLNALKYILRFPFKGNAAQDLAKAERYLGMWRDRQVSA